MNIATQFDTATYDYTGILIRKDDNIILYFYREGTAHATNDSTYSRIKGRSYNIRTGEWSASWNVYENADNTLHATNICGGLNATKDRIILFLSLVKKGYVSGSGPIAAFADAGGGEVEVTTSGPHGMSSGDRCVISATTNYNGCYVITVTAVNKFKITHSWDGNDATGTRTKTGSFTSMGYIMSTGLAGTSWGTYQEIFDNTVEPVYAGLNPHGRIVHLGNGHLLMPWFTHQVPLTDQYILHLMRSIDNGVTWDEDYQIIYFGSTWYGEQYIVNIGEDLLFCLARNNSAAYAIGYSVSEDGGKTWSAMTATGITGTGQNLIVALYYDPVTKAIIYITLDRGGSGTVKMGELNAVHGWIDPADIIVTQIDSGYTYNGYGSIEKIRPGQYLCIWAKQISITDSDIIGGVYSTEQDIDFPECECIN